MNMAMFEIKIKIMDNISSLNGKLDCSYVSLKPGSHMPAVCLRQDRYACICRRYTGKVELKSTFPAYRRCNWRKSAKIGVKCSNNVWAPSPARRRHTAGIFVNQAKRAIEYHLVYHSRELYKYLLGYLEVLSLIVWYSITFVLVQYDDTHLLNNGK